jgi:hypothetical protein
MCEWLCYSSCFMGLSSLVLHYMKEDDLSFLMGVLCMTSLNHWRDYVDRGIRQTVDIAWVYFCIVYIFYYIMNYGTDFQQYLSMSVLLCIILFYKAYWLFPEQWVFFHMSIHLYASFFIPVALMLD